MTCRAFPPPFLGAGLAFAALPLRPCVGAPAGLCTCLQVRLLRADLLLPWARKPLAIRGLAARAAQILAFPPRLEPLRIALGASCERQRRSPS